jgi:hypothetical protein
MLTVLCSDHDPNEFEAYGTKNSKLHGMRMDYGSKVLIQAQMIITSYSTDKDIIAPLSLDYDCCLAKERKSKLNLIHLDLPINHVVSNLDDLKSANYRVEDVEKFISEQELELKHSIINYHLPLLSHAGMIIMFLIFVMFCYCCCCKCFHRWPKSFRCWKDNSPCTTTVFKPKIINSIHSSRESLQCHLDRVQSTQDHGVIARKLPDWCG